MNEDREQLNERYLEAQLRGSLGPETDISERVLHAVYAKPPRRIIPGPRRVAAWGSRAAAAAVLIAAGVATYALVQILPDELRTRSEQAEQPARQDPRRTAPAEGTNQSPVRKDWGQSTPHGARPETELPPVSSDRESGGTAPAEPAPDKRVPEQPLPDDLVDDSYWPPGYTDPPGSWPDPKRAPQPPDETAPSERALLVTSWRGESLRVTRDGREQKWKAGEIRSLLDGDRVQPKGTAEFTLADGTLLRLEGDVTFGGEKAALRLTLHDGALYADTASPLVVSTDEVLLSLEGVAVIEERLHGVDVFCISGRASAGEAQLSAGFQARLEKDGFGREKAITWADVQREFKFLKDAPARTMLIEELIEEPGNLFGGEIVDGVLAGDVDSDVGIGFYLREPYAFRTGDVVRFRFRVGKACEMILQFGTVEDANWRHKLGGVKAGEWIEYELPLVELYKTTDVALKAEPGLSLKFFQLHPEEATAHIEIDRFEVVHRP